MLTIPRNASTTALALGQTAIVGAVTGANLVSAVDTAEGLTLFVPINEAFQAAGSAFIGASIKTLQQVLEYHVVTGAIVFSTDITNTTVPSLQGGDLTLTVIDGTIFVNTAKVVIPNILLSDGVAHVIDV